MNVYKAINAVQRELAKVGITKNRKNIQQNYSFRGIDEVFNTLSPLLAEHELCILPRMISRTCEERTTKNGGSMNYVTVEAEFDFISSADGSSHIVRTFGEAMDSADKATNKAMSAAYKYAAFQAFSIPTEGDNDADAHTHSVAERMPAHMLADWLTFIDDSTSVGELKERLAQAEDACAADPDALAKVKAAAATKAAKAKKPTKEAA